MARIAFYSNHFAQRGGTGISRYARSLVEALGQLRSHLIIPVATWSDFNKQELDNLSTASGLRLLPTGRLLTSAAWRLLRWPRIEQLLGGEIDLVHNAALNSPVPTTKPQVVTIHDIGPLLYPDYFTARSQWNMKKNLAYAVGDHAFFLCVSHTTAGSLQEYAWQEMSVDLSERTHVIYEGVSDAILSGSQERYSSPSTYRDESETPFVLAVGKISPRKNLEGTIRALAQIRDQIPHQLVTVGGDGWDFDAVKGLAAELGIEERVRFLGYVSDETLGELYRTATAFVFPSFFEGFGLPIVEAMASGCPVITSDVSVLPEIAAHAALLVDPTKSNDIADAIEAFCTDHNLRETYRQRGFKRAMDFTWRRCALETAQLYERLLRAS